MEGKTQIYNLIILDKSGSMDSIRTAALDGLNETINGIKKAQQKYADTQQHYLTVHSFCGCTQEDIYDRIAIDSCKLLTAEQYEPCCMTPLYDAMGITLKKMSSVVKSLENYAVVVTVITDGLENASKEYTGKQVADLIGKLREEGWTFSYIGANHDVEEAAKKIGITNSRTFTADAAGTTMAMRADAEERSFVYDSLNEMALEAPMMSREERAKHISTLNRKLSGHKKEK